MNGQLLAPAALPPRNRPGSHCATDLVGTRIEPRVVGHPSRNLITMSTLE
jgi:hypothetical protein